MRKPTDVNFGIHPHDPDYHDDYDYEKELCKYEMEIEMEEDDRRAERDS